MAKLISFDIDGTLEVGDPPGYITMDMVRQAKDLGYIIGSCSDRTISNQQRIWRTAEITVSFTVLKHQLDSVKAEFPAEEYYHIGDTDLDRMAATRAGVEGDDIVRIRTPLINLKKIEIIRHGLRLSVDYSQTHSCYDPAPNGRPCEHCDACLIRAQAFQKIGMADPGITPSQEGQ